MLKNLLLIASAMAVATTAGAQTRVYQSDELGEVNGVSPNGKYAAITDTENEKAFIWSQDKPEEWIDITPLTENPDGLPSSKIVVGADAYGVSNDGMVVGSILYKDGVKKPAIYRNGEWELLPMHAASRNTNEAIAVTWDGRVIAGYMFLNDADGEIPGHYYPCRWELNEDGEYDLTAYTDIKLPEHQGFYPLCMSPDGQIIAGMVYCGIGATAGAWITAEGEFHMMAKEEVRYEPWIWQGKYETRDENGKQGWTDDPDDPNITLYESIYIDGVKDDNTHPWNGAFCGVDWNGNLYGKRTVATDVDLNEGTGTLTDYAAMYNMATEEWTDYPGITTLITGLEGKIIFASNATVIEGDNETAATTKFDFESERAVTALSHTSSNGQVLGGMTEQMNPASMEMQYYPMIVILEEALVETPENPNTGGNGKPDSIEVVTGTTVSQPIVLVDGNCINVSNASAVAVYDLDGRMVGTGNAVTVAAGIYVVKADNVSRKVIVK